MARAVPVGEEIGFGSDASVDDYVSKSVCVWWRARPDAGAFGPTVIKRDVTEGWTFAIERALALETDAHLSFLQDFTVVDGTWTTPNNSITLVTNTAVAFTYNRGSTANDPNIYINGVLQAEAELTPPAGAAESDAANSLVLGGGTDAVVAFLVVDSSILTAAQVNRHRWHGHPGGMSSIDVWHPMWTNADVNKGTATANATPSGGVTQASIPRVERAWGASMGCGR